MTIEEIKQFEDAYVKVTGFRYLRSWDMAKVLYGGIKVQGEMVYITDATDGTEDEVHYQEIKEIEVL